LAGLKTENDSFVYEVTSELLNSGMPHLDCFILEDGNNTFDRKSMPSYRQTRHCILEEGDINYNAAEA